MSEMLSDTQIDLLLTGSPNADPELVEALTELRTLAVWAPDPSQQTAHIVAAMTTVMGIGAVPVARAGLLATTMARPKSRRRLVFATAMSSLLAKILAGSLVAFAATGGLAATGNLPEPVQAAVSDVASQVGVDVPHPGDDDGAVADVDDGPVADVDEGPVADVDEGPVADTDDDAVENTDDGAAENTDDGAAENTDDGAGENGEDGTAGDGSSGNGENGSSGDTDDGSTDS